MSLVVVNFKHRKSRQVRNRIEISSKRRDGRQTADEYGGVAGTRSRDHRAGKSPQTFFRCRRYAKAPCTLVSNAS